MFTSDLSKHMLMLQKWTVEGERGREPRALKVLSFVRPGLSTLNKIGSRFLETSIYQTTRRHIPEDTNLPLLPVQILA